MACTWFNYGVTVWVDDMFMGTALLAAWSRISGEVEHLDYAAGQVVFWTRMSSYITGVV